MHIRCISGVCLGTWCGPDDIAKPARPYEASFPQTAFAPCAFAEASYFEVEVIPTDAAAHVADFEVEVIPTASVTHVGCHS